MEKKLKGIGVVVGMVRYCQTQRLPRILAIKVRVVRGE